MSKLVSIILPVYNRAYVVQECVDSVLKQSYENFEILLVDDGSTDNSAAVCQEMAGRDSRIRFFSEKHKGVSAARNFALEAAKGEYFFFLDSDDVIYPLLLETLVMAMEERGALIGGTDVARASAQNWHKVRTKMEEHPVCSETTFQGNEETLSALLRGGSPLSCIGGTMIHRNLVGDTTFCTDLHIGEDFYFLYENVIKGTSSIFLKKKWYYVRLHEHNSSWDYSYSGFWTRFYRRKLVWESEDSQGRQEFANIQKRDAFGCYVVCLQKNAKDSPDVKRMQNDMKEHRTVLMPALSIRGKVGFLLSVYAPAVYHAISPLEKRLRSAIKKLV